MFKPSFRTTSRNDDTKRWIATSPTATQSAPSVSLSLNSSPNYFGGASDNKSFEDEILDKLRVFTEEYCKWANIKTDLEADYLFNKYLDDFIKDNDDSDLVKVLTFFRENEDKAFKGDFKEGLKQALPLVTSPLRLATQATSPQGEAFWIATQSTTARNDNTEQFILEFIRAFCYGEDINAIFQPIVWKSEKFRKLFTTLSIKVLSTNKELLKRYLIEIVADTDNLLLGFAYLNRPI